MIRLDLHTPSAQDNPLAVMQARLPQALAGSLEQALDAGLEAARQTLAGRLRPGSSGALAASLSRESRGYGLSLEGELYSELPYAAAQEYGALIQATRAKYLKFRVEGRWVQVRRVLLPARPYLGPGAEAVAGALEENLSRALMEELT